MTILSSLFIFIISALAVAAQTLNVIYSFNGQSDGQTPFGGLALGQDGNFYGTTPYGGSYSNGTVFRITPTGEFTPLMEFDGTNGNLPNGLIAGRDGKFYGTTLYASSGYSSQGTVFQITTNGLFTRLAALSDVNAGWTQRNLTEGDDGVFYGTTASGGTNGGGTVFRVTTNGNLTVLYSFGESVNGPDNQLVPGPGSTFYGATVQGGSNDLGTVFQVTTNGELTTLMSFNGTNGRGLGFGLVRHSSGNFYGTTWFGGSNDQGIVFNLTTNGSLTTIYSFTGFADGSNPRPSLVEGLDGSLYGTTYSGGTNNLGTVFRITTNGAFSLLVSFNGTNGANPSAGLVRDSRYNFWGTTFFGGSSNLGTIFRLSMPGLTIQPISQTIDGDGFALSVKGLTGHGPVLLYASTNLADWLPILTNPAASGSIQLRDFSATNHLYRFYRVQEL